MRPAGAAALKGTGRSVPACLASNCFPTQRRRLLNRNRLCLLYSCGGPASAFSCRTRAHDVQHNA